MNRYSREIEKRVFKMHFEGVQRDKIGRSLGIPPSSVTEILRVLPPVLNPLRELSKELRKNQMILHDALPGAQLIIDLRALGIEPDQFSSALQAVMKISTEAGYKPENVVQAGAKLIELEKESNKSYTEAIKEFEIVNKKTRKQKQKYKKYKELNSVLTREIDENTRRRNETLQQAKVAPQEIAEYKSVKKGLKPYGINMHDPKNLRNYLDNMNETGCNPKRFVSFTKKHGSINKSLAAAKKQTQSAQDESTKLQKTNKQESAAVSQITQEKNWLLTVVQILRAKVYSLLTQVAQLSNKCAELETLRKATIVTIARNSGIPDSYIEYLQLNNQFNVLEEQIKTKFPQFFKK